MKTAVYPKSDFARMLEAADQIRQEAFNSISDHIIITDQDGVILYANPAAEEKTGFARAEMVGKTPGELWGRVMSRKFYEEMWKTIKVERKPFTGTVKNRHKDGTYYFAELRIYPVFDSKNNSLLFIGIEPDISQRVEAEKSRDEFTAMVAHQIKSPLTAANLFLHTLGNKSGKLSKKQKNIVKRLGSINRNLTDLVKDLLFMARLEKRDVEGERSESIATLIEQVIDEVRILAEEDRVILNFKAGKDIILPLHPGLFREILRNLLDNAISYSYPQKKVEVFLEERRDRVIVSIIDQGIGIPSGSHNKVFTPFFRASNAEGQKSGTGLGLFIAKKFADVLGYELWFESEEGKGTTFFLAIPIKR